MPPRHPDSFSARSTLVVGSERYTVFRLDALRDRSRGNVDRLPFSLRILLENLLRGEDGAFVKAADIAALAAWDVTAPVEKEIAFRTSRVLLQDFTGVPCVVDLAAMRDAIVRLGGDPARINPLIPAELVIDHSVMVDHYGSSDALNLNALLEFQRNRERYTFLRWGQSAFDNFSVVPPDTGIVHQVNLEFLAPVTFERSDEIGIVAAAEGVDGHYYVLDDGTLRAGPEMWAKAAIHLYRKHKADRIVAERNFGGAMVQHTIRTVDNGVPFKEVVASRGKVQRAEPISALYEKGLVHHVSVDRDGRPVDLGDLEVWRDALYRAHRKTLSARATSVSAPSIFSRFCSTTRKALPPA